jgi:hypothetical protein
VVPADPLAAVAARWQAMWEVGSGSGAAAFEEQAARALTAWRARQFELADYYVVLAPAGDAPPGRPAQPGGPAGPARSAGPAGSAGRARPAGGTRPTGPAGRTGSAAPGGTDDDEPGPDFYLGPLRAARPHRVVVVPPGAEPAGQVRDALRSLPHGPWWPPLDELLDAIRGFYAGALAAAGGPLSTR